MSGPYLSYYESADGQMIRPRRVLRELLDHALDDVSIDEFFREFGFRPEYDAQDVLSWLGY